MLLLPALFCTHMQQEIEKNLELFATIIWMFHKRNFGIKIHDEWEQTEYKIVRNCRPIWVPQPTEKWKS